MSIQHGCLGRAHEDERRLIEEWNGIDMSVQRFTVHKSNLPLGKHFHRRKRETFVIQEGGGEVLLATVDEEGKKTGEIGTLALAPGSVVAIDPMVAHTFYLTPGSLMLCLSSAPFNPTNMDLHLTEWLVR